MVQAGVEGLDTPRTNVGDRTYMSNPPIDFDITQEQSFHEPSRDNNDLFQQLQNGRRGGTIATPRRRVALSDRRNMPPNLGGGEFTPLLKSATRNSALRNGKENNPRTPAFLKPGGLGNIPEDFSPLPVDSSVYNHSRNESYMAGTPAQVDTSSTASTPMAILPRRNEGPGVLQDGNQLSLREQENVIDKIEKENFGLKLKIHFLEEALRKAGPGFSEKALKENTELKVDKVTMQKELLRYKKTLTTAERDVEQYRQQLIEMQEKIKRKHSNEGQKEELDRLRQILEEREEDLSRLRGQEGQYEDLEDKLQDLEADIREKNRIIEDHEDEVENLKDEVQKQADTIETLEEEAKKAQRRAIELEEQALAGEELEEAKETIEDLEQQILRLKNDAAEAEESREEALREKERAVSDLEELQDEMANKSITTKGLSRQIEEKANRLQDALEELREQHTSLEKDRNEKLSVIHKLEKQIDELVQVSESREQKLQEQLEAVQNERDSALKERLSFIEKLENAEREVQQKVDEKNLLQLRHDSLTSESVSLQKDLTRARVEIEDLSDKLEHEKSLALSSDREVRDNYKAEQDRLNDLIEDLRAKLRQKERLYEDDSDKWERERKNLESQKATAEQRASDLQSTVDKLEQLEGALSGKELKLQEAIHSEKSRRETQEISFKRQIDELNEDVENRRKTYEEARSELLTVKEELRLSQREQKTLVEKIEGLEDEIEVLQTNMDEESEQARKSVAAAKQESESLRRQIQSLKLDVARLETEAADAHAELEVFRSDIQIGQGSHDRLNARLKEAESQLSKARHEKQSIQEQLSKLNDDLNSVRSAKADIEADRDELQDQLEMLKHQSDDTSRFNLERADIRTSKLKLDAEIRRLRDENKAVLAQQELLEQELQQEIDQAATEQARLNTEIHDLQRILRGSSEKRELATAKKTIQQLEIRVQELESQAATSSGDTDEQEVSLLRKDLSAARQKESEYVQREVAQKDAIRSLKMQVSDLERKAHDMEISRFVDTSPKSSVGGSARKNELIEVRAQLAGAHHTLKDLRTQLRTVEKETQQKLSAASLELEARVTAWEAEKDELERALEDVEFQNKELHSKNTTSEATMSRLRSKIERLEKSLQSERLKPSNDRSIINERHELEEILRETQLQVESLNIIVADRDKKIASLSISEENLRSQLKRIRSERSDHKSTALTASDQLTAMKQKFRRAQQTWENERRSLTKGVRFAHQSVSINDESQLIATLKQEWEAQAHHHVKEMRGMNMQVEWLLAKVHRMEGFRKQAAYAKKYMAMQIECFEACNKADLRLLEASGVPRPVRPPKKKTLRSFVHVVRATLRMRKGVAAWQEKQRIHDLLVGKAKQQRIQEVVRSDEWQVASHEENRVEQLRLDLGNITY